MTNTTADPLFIAFPLLGKDYDGAMFVDLINTGVVTLFLNCFR